MIQNDKGNSWLCELGGPDRYKQKHLRAGTENVVTTPSSCTTSQDHLNEFHLSTNVVNCWIVTLSAPSSSGKHPTQLEYPKFCIMYKTYFPDFQNFICKMRN